MAPGSRIQATKPIRAPIGALGSATNVAPVSTTAATAVAMRAVVRSVWTART